MSDWDPDEMVAEFYRSFCKQYCAAYERSFGEKLSEPELQKLLLRHFRWLFRRRRNRRKQGWGDVDKIFASLGPMTPRQDSRWRREILVRHYGRLGKPPCSPPRFASSGRISRRLPDVRA
jgi:hypothetical protein